MKYEVTARIGIKKRQRFFFLNISNDFTSNSPVITPLFRCFEFHFLKKVLITILKRKIEEEPSIINFSNIDLALQSHISGTKYKKVFLGIRLLTPPPPHRD